MVETASMTSVHKLLKMIVGQTCVTIYDGSVTNIAYAGPLTPLPFAESAVEGLANLDGRPIVQVDLSRALGGPAGTGAKLAVVTVPAGEIALRVQDAVFDADTAAETSDAAEALDIPALLPWTADLRLRAANRATDAAPPAEAPAPPVHFLLATAGGETFSLLVTGDERVEEVQAIHAADGASRLVVAAGNRLLAGRRLGAAMEGGAGTAPWAIVAKRCGGGEFALVVDRVLALKELCPSRLFTLEDGNGEGGKGQSALWYVEDGVIRPLPSTAAAFAGTTGTTSAPPSPLHSGAPATPPSVGEEAALPLPDLLGVRTDCAGIAVVLPFGMVRAALDGLPDLGSRRPRCSDGAASAVLDGAMLLGRSGSPSRGHHLVVCIHGFDIVLTVDAVCLEPERADRAWQPFPQAHPGSAALFDAVRWDGTADKWIYRVGIVPPFASLPPRLRRSIARAKVGWIHLVV
jgi:hypothetical protein